MERDRLMLTEACDQAIQLVSQTREMERLYQKAVQSVGEGALRTGILGLAVDAMEDEELKNEVFVNDESLLSFFCGIWIQYLLVEVAGITREKLKALAADALRQLQKDKRVH
ncbi:MAG TPA: hypothetical protein PLM79_06865 [Syntrophobacteraceae bacterium]|nr:hypothetical protein [Syntrophobacteraceae bacterium]